VQVDTITARVESKAPILSALGTVMSLLLSTVAIKFNLRRYLEEDVMAQQRDEKATAAAAAAAAAVAAAAAAAAAREEAAERVNAVKLQAVMVFMEVFEDALENPEVPLMQLDADSLAGACTRPLLSST